MPPRAQVRLRITRQLHESIDGIQFSSFRLGYVYEVGTTVANYLLAVRAAEPLPDDEEYIVLPPERQLFHPSALAPRHAASATASFNGEPRDIAADRSARKPRTAGRRYGQRLNARD